MRTDRKTLAGYVLAGGAILAFAVLLGFALVRLWETEAETRRSIADNMLWAIAQAHSAALLLDNAVARRVGAVPGDADIALRYDILLSRLTLLSQGPQARYMEELGFARPLSAHEAAVRGLEDALRDLKQGDRRPAVRVHEVLRPLVADLGRAANRSMVRQWDATGARRDAINAAVTQVIVSIVAILVLGAIICLIMVRALLTGYRTQQALRREQDMREAYRSFVDLVSHQFRTPLAVIDSSMQRILRQGEAMPADEIARRAGRVREAVGGLARLIETTLEGMRLDDGEPEPRKEPCDVAAAIRSVAARQGELTPERQVDLRLAADLPRGLVTDPVLLEQILANLLSNAVKYSPESEPVGVVARVEQDRVAISVHDNGIGIGEDELGLVFGRFFRSKAASGIPGTGLGLNVSSRLARLLGGTLELSSRQGVGSTFTLRLPLVVSTETDAA